LMKDLLFERFTVLYFMYIKYLILRYVYYYTTNGHCNLTYTILGVYKLVL